MSTQWGPVIGTLSNVAEPAPRAKRKAFFKRKQFLIAGAMLALVFGYLIYMGVRSAGVYYMSVSEVLAQRETLGSQFVRIQGKVVSDSVQDDTANTTIRFNVSDGQSTLPVVYRGIVPDSFRPDADVVMEGTLGPSGTFEAKSLLAKCASKYSPAKG